MRIVLDTNVLIAGMLSATGPPGRILEAVLAGDLELALDMAVREEYEDVLRRAEFRFPQGHVDDLLVAIDQYAFWVAAAPALAQPLPDPDDEPFLAVAAATGSVLITGNLKHYPVRSRQGVIVLTPREFDNRLRRRL